MDVERRVYHEMLENILGRQSTRDTDALPIDEPGGEDITGRKIDYNICKCAGANHLLTDRNRSTWFCVLKSLADAPQPYVHESYYTPGTVYASIRASESGTGSIRAR
ncbi:hypothetical protein CIHG_06412 [Coccidioides immitis H538.4]|uniref:Uncharacterized protein n=1 Tax=Coccidioides immitis H538.4 TaxID=396776 RepID=A0A0J8RX76_COCIT|nr:hypothetical protein CIHG_06412 [Coccidioides immitis H538.4]